MKIAGVQMEVVLGDCDANLNKMTARFTECRQAGAELVVFPECALTGYCFDSAAEARQLAQPIPGPATHHFSQVCKEQGGYAVFGLIEEADNQIFNAAALVGPEGLIGSYRKIHLPFLGADMFTDYGDRPFAVHETDGVRIGMTICYDAAFPEAARALSLLGADLIVLPTNWPTGAEGMPMHAINTRALENGVYYAAVNRVGKERGIQFIGMSRICGPSGEVLASSTGVDEEILYAEIDPESAREKRVSRVPGKHALDRLADRRPEMYGLLTEPHDLKRPGRK